LLAQGLRRFPSKKSRCKHQSDYDETYNPSSNGVPIDAETLCSVVVFILTSANLLHVEAIRDVDRSDDKVGRSSRCFPGFRHQLSILLLV